jgi:hypothetical protein
MDRPAGLADLGPGPFIPTLYERALKAHEPTSGARVEGSPLWRPEVFGPCYWPLVSRVTAVLLSRVRQCAEECGDMRLSRAWRRLSSYGLVSRGDWI